MVYSIMRTAINSTEDRTMMGVSHGKMGAKPKTGKVIGAGVNPGTKRMKAIKTSKVKPTMSGIKFKPF